jgi:hypothetical protein
MTPREFLDLSTKLCKDLQYWISEAHRDGVLAEHHLKVLNSAIEVINQVTLQDVSNRPET